MTDQLRFFPQRHPVHRLSKEMKAEIAKAQNSIRSAAFPNAFSFCERVLSDLKVSIAPPEKLRDQPAKAVADLDIADLIRFFGGILRTAEIPESARQQHSENLARRAQLVRAFDRPDNVLGWVATKVITVVADLPKTASDIERG